MTTVTLIDTTVTASKIGALGTYEKTFTKVTETNTSLSGILVQDHYRITYDVKGTGFNTDKLAKVLRTEQKHMADGTLGAITITPSDGVPGKPENDTSNIFAGWYINRDGKRTALGKRRGTTSGRTYCQNNPFEEQPLKRLIPRMFLLMQMAQKH
ncbi:MAG: hypothetical protein ACLR5B_07105 [Blautia sp.]